MRRIAALSLVAIAVVSGCTATPVSPTPSPDTEGFLTFEHDGIVREYLYYEPPDLPDGAPVVFLLHGYTSDAAEIRASFEFDRVADEHGFAVVYPQGSLDTWGDTHWNAYVQESTTDDIGFLTALARDLQDRHGLDPNRTFVSGFSNGGFMTYVLATEAPAVFRAGASIAGSMSGTSWANRDDGSVFPLLQVSGLADTVVPVDGSLGPGRGWGGAPAMPEIIDYWSTRAECTSVLTDKIGENTTRERHVGCAGNYEIWYLEIEGLDHSVPAVDNTAGFDVAELIWEFFDSAV
ncbi:MAG: prolyl oligopeptidase family serine peptidase [Demequinaceae bacterium]|nr:prolyl oligopeptidase family serine peptidase [Demequinaceae bacterium]